MSVLTFPGQMSLFEDGWCQRTTERRHSWRHVSEGGFDKRRYQVTPIEYRHAQPFVLHHHYLASYPSVKQAYGLVEVDKDRLVGVLTLGTPTNELVITNPLPTLGLSTGADLSRLVLLDEVPANAESWFIGQVLPHAFQQGMRGIVAFADGVPRPDAGLPGHVGTIYQASNASWCGRATAGPLTVLPNGTVLTRRTLQKVRKGERGAAGVVRRLVAAGADEPEDPKGGREYLRRALRQVEAMNVPHPGPFRFVMRLGTERQQRRVPFGEGYEPRKGYPKQPDPMPVYRPVGAAA